MREEIAHLTPHTSHLTAPVFADALVSAPQAAGKKDVPIVFCADANYGLYLPVVVQSIIENSSETYHYHIIVLDCGIAKDAVDALVRQIRQYDNFSLHVKNIEDWLEQHKEGFAEQGHITRGTYGRFAIPELCRGYDKVIYADIDMVFNRDIAELIEIDLEGNYIAGVRDICQECECFLQEKNRDYLREVLHLTAEETYINAGLLVLNTEAWREHRLSEKAIRFLSERKLKFLDQDAINSICRGNIRYLSEIWNGLSYIHNYVEQHYPALTQRNVPYSAALIDKYWKKYPLYETVSHYNGPIKPWHSFRAPMADRWWYHAMKTPFYGRYMGDIVQPPPKKDFSASADIYKILGIPVWTVKTLRKGKKYYLGGIRIAKKKQGNTNSYLYVFGIKLLSVKRKQG